MVNMNRILLAEDNDDLRELITDFLSEHGFDVYAAVDGEDAWEAVQTTRYQLVLLDVMMPGMDGFTLCRKIRERESVPVLFLTARVLEEDQLRGYELGADDYILKPFSLPHFHYQNISTFLPNVRQYWNAISAECRRNSKKVCGKMKNGSSFSAMDSR